MNQIGINTSQNVDVYFNVSSIGDRIFAYIIDVLIMFGYIAAISWLLFKILDFDNFFKGLDNWSVAAIMIMIYAPVLFYTLIFESLFEGQTPGKMLFKIKVVKIDGYQAGFGDYFMRWFMRLIDIYSNMGVVGIVSIIVTKHHQRLGDIVSGCAVITLKNKVNISHTILEELKLDYQPSYPQVILLNDNDMRIIKENYQRGIRNKDGVIISKLVDKVKQTIKIDSSIEQKDHLVFLDIIIKDYNYYTAKS